MKYIYLPFIILTLIFTSCRKDLTEVITTTDEDPPVVLIRSSVKGVVVDGDGEPIAGASVTIRSENISANNDGTFEFMQAKLKKSGAVVTAQTNGYYEGVSHSIFTSDGSSYVRITIPNRRGPGQFSSSDVGRYSLNNGFRVITPKNALQMASGNSFNGSVNLYARELDVSSQNFAAIMPGALTALDEDGAEQVLESFAMMVMEFEDLNGSKLEIADGEEVLVEIPIPDDLLSDAPEEVDLWQYDIEQSRWLKKGSCIKNGSTYTCNIPSSGYWTCAVSLPAICLSGEVLNNDESPSPYLKVVIENLTDNFIYWGYTDINGMFCGSVPRGALLKIAIIDLCDNIVHTADIGPFAEDLHLDDILLGVIVEEYFLKIVGQVHHCHTDDFVDGHLGIRYPGKIRIVPFVDDFDYNMGLKCIEFPELEITVYSATQRRSTVQTIHNSFADIDLVDQPTCEDLDDFFDLDVGGINYWASPTKYSYEKNSTTPWLLLDGLSGGGTMRLELRNYVGVGQYTDNAFLTVTNDNGFNPTYPNLTSSGPNITVDISSDDGTYIVGSVVGTAKDVFNVTHNVNGDFKIRKAP